MDDLQRLPGSLQGPLMLRSATPGSPWTHSAFHNCICVRVQQCAENDLVQMTKHESGK